MPITITGGNDALNTAVDAFATAPGSSQAYANAIAYILNKNPDAVTQLNRAFDTGGLGQNAFTIGSTPNTGALYDLSGQHIILNAGSLDRAATDIANNNPLSSNVLNFVFQFFHEDWHADNGKDDQQAKQATVSLISESGGSADLDNAISAMNDIGANAEGGGEIKGYDGLVRYVAEASPANSTIDISTVLANLDYRNDFSTDGSTLRPGYISSSTPTRLANGTTINAGVLLSAPTSDVVGGQTPDAQANLNVLNTQYFFNSTNLVGPYGGAQYADVYNVSLIEQAVNYYNIKQESVNISFNTYGLDIGQLVAAMAGVNTQATGSGSIDDLSNGSTYYVSWKPGAATVTIETANSAGATSVIAAGIGGLVTQTGVPVTVAQDSSATAVGNLGPITLESGGSITTSSASQTETVTASPDGIGPGGNPTSTATVTGAATIKSGVSNGHDAELVGSTSNGGTASLELQANGQFEADTSGFTVNMGNGSNVDTTGGQTVIVTCGNLAGGGVFKATISDPNSSSTVCTVDSHGVGTLHFDGTPGTITDNGTGGLFTFAGTGSDWDNLYASNAQVDVGQSVNLNIFGSGANSITGSAGSQVADSSSGDTFFGALPYSLTLAANNLAETVDAANLAVNALAGVTTGTVTLGANGASVVDYSQGLAVGVAPGVSNVVLSLGAPVAVAVDSSGLIVNGVNGGTVWLNGDNLSLADDVGALGLALNPGHSGGSVALGINNADLWAYSTGLAVSVAPGVNTGGLSLAANDLNTTILNGSFTVRDVYNATGGNLLLGGGGIALVDNASLIGVYDSLGGSGGTVTVGQGNATVEDHAQGLTLANAAGVTSSIVNLGESALGLTLNTSGFTLRDVPGKSGGSVFFGADGLHATDQTGVIGVWGVTGVTTGSVTLGANDATLVDLLPNLTIDAAAGVSGGAVDLYAANMTLADNALDLTVANSAGGAGNTVNVANYVNTALVLGGGFTINEGLGDDLGQIAIQGTSGTDVLNSGNGSGSDVIGFNPSSDVTYVLTHYDGAGAATDSLANLASGGSQYVRYNPDSSTLDSIASFSGADGTGALLSVTLDSYGNTSSTYYFDYDESGHLAHMQAITKDGSGNIVGSADYVVPTEETSGWGRFDGYSQVYSTWKNIPGWVDYTEYTFFGLNGVSPVKGSSLTGLAGFEANLGDTTAAIGAQTGQLQAQAAAETPTAAGLASATLAPYVWSAKVITWTMDPSTGAGTPFTGTLAAEYENAVQQAFQTWAQASGLTFVEAPGANADIKIGLAQFDSADTGIQGLSQVDAGMGRRASAAQIMLEDPGEDALATDAKGQLAYTGTQTELGQLLLHEIGHVLGLADSSDPRSIMAAVLSNANDTLDVTDTQGIQALYGPSATGTPSAATVSYWAELQAESAQMVQAMAGLTAMNGAALSAQGLWAGADQPIHLAAALH